MKKYVVIGASAAGMAALSQLRLLNKKASIVCINAEQEDPYNKCFLADYLSGEKEKESLNLKPVNFFKEHDIEYYAPYSVATIDRVAKEVVCNDGTRFAYDRLLIATGSRPRTPNFDGIEQAANSFYFNTLADTQLLLDYVKEHDVKRLVVVGGGLSGLECADSLSEYVDSVTLVNRGPYILNRQLTQEASEFLEQEAIKTITLEKGIVVENVLYENNKISSLVLSHGKQLEADMVVWTMGVISSSECAQNIGIDHHNGALLTNEYLQTNDETIFAAGDVALVTHALTGQKIPSRTWPDAIRQGMIAAKNMIVSQSTVYGGIIPTVSTAVFGKKVMAAGVIAPVSPESAVTTDRDKASGEFMYIVTQNNVVKGFIAIGRTLKVSHLRRSLLTAKPL